MIFKCFHKIWPQNILNKQFSLQMKQYHYKKKLKRAGPLYVAFTLSSNPNLLPPVSRWCHPQSLLGISPVSTSSFCIRPASFIYSQVSIPAAATGPAMLYILLHFFSWTVTYSKSSTAIFTFWATEWEACMCCTEFFGSSGHCLNPLFCQYNIKHHRDNI